LRKLENQLQIESEPIKKFGIESKKKDHHQTLELNLNASQDKIRENYKKLALS
jgi:hypothetical protein